MVSLPFALPWLLFPVITQGDQIIDNLSINWMRLVTHVLLAALFAAPVAIIVLSVRYAVGRHGPPQSKSRVWTVARIVPGLYQMAGGRQREGASILAAALLSAEIGIAVRFLGELMVITLILMIWAVLIYSAYGRWEESGSGRQQRSERFALGLLLIGVVTSLGLFFGFKNRPGAYQGSPSYYMDPAQRDKGFDLSVIDTPTTPPAPPQNPDGVRRALTGYARALEQLLAGYYVLDRNYNYHFHNELFLRSTPLLPEYRKVGLLKIKEGETLRAAADRMAAAARPALPPVDPLRALLDTMTSFAAFTFDRAPVLERMSKQFEQTPAGLQHATHLYEGEGKVLSVRVGDILAKHSAVLSSPLVAPITTEFVTISRSVRDAYANRIVGF
jgi:hypothetical protein